MIIRRPLESQHLCVDPGANPAKLLLHKYDSNIGNALARSALGCSPALRRGAPRIGAGAAPLCHIHDFASHPDCISVEHHIQRLSSWFSRPINPFPAISTNCLLLLSRHTDFVLPSDQSRRAIVDPLLMELHGQSLAAPIKFKSLMLTQGGRAGSAPSYLNGPVRTHAVPHPRASSGKPVWTG